MSSISLPLKMLVAGSALAGLTMLACGGDDSGSTKADAGSTKSDAAVKDAAVKKDAASPIATGAVEGDDCTGIGGMCDADQCDTPPCYAKCTDGVYDACMTTTSLINTYLGDSGFKLPTSLNTDAGTYSIKDGSISVSFGDGGQSVDIPLMGCPAPLKCSSGGGSLAATLVGATGLLPAGAGFCGADDGIGFPPACSTQADCATAKLTTSTCAMGYCINPCK